jgi:hypothetical protein
MELPKELETGIRDALALLGAERVILSDSRAWGEPTQAR